MDGKKSSLFKKYFVASVSILLASVLIMGISLLSFVSDYWTTSKIDVLKENVETVSKTTQELFESGKIDKDNETSVFIMCNMLNIMSSAIEADVFVTDLQGRIILCKDLLSTDMEVLNGGKCEKHNGYKIPKRILEMAQKGEGYSMDELEGMYEESHIIVSDKINSNGKTIGYVFATEPVVEGLRPFIGGMVRLFLFAAIITIVLTSTVVYGFTYSITKPLQEMSKMIKNYANGDFSQRVIITNNDELGELAQGLNAMAKSLATIEASRRSFVANVSHELKTPMTTIGGFIDGVLDGTIPPEKQDYYLRIVSDEVKRLSRLVISMLNLSKIEAGELTLNKNTFDISHMIFNILITFEQRIDKKHIMVEGLEKLQTIAVDADEDLIHQVIYNLVDNAVKFTEEGGSIRVSVAQEKDRIIAGIRNTGGGIPSEEVGRIFERFYKVDKSRSEDVKGAGLGLYLVKSIVEMHGGQIAARSKQGEYTEFIFWIPKNIK
ncbi:MAG: HAMP domain-containing sensor histidine kinase [Oscillospiraceae bacterium]